MTNTDELKRKVIDNICNKLWIQRKENKYKKVKKPLGDKVIVLHFITTRVSTLWVSSGYDKYHANIEVYTDVKQLSAQFI